MYTGGSLPTSEFRRWLDVFCPGNGAIHDIVHFKILRIGVRQRSPQSRWIRVLPKKEVVYPPLYKYVNRSIHGPFPFLRQMVCLFLSGIVQDTQTDCERSTRMHNGINQPKVRWRCMSYQYSSNITPQNATRMTFDLPMLLLPFRAQLLLGFLHWHSASPSHVLLQTHPKSVTTWEETTET